MLAQLVPPLILLLAGCATHKEVELTQKILDLQHQLEQQQSYLSGCQDDNGMMQRGLIEKNNELNRARQMFPNTELAISGTRIPQRVRTEIQDGIAMAFADGHFWPDHRSVAHAAFLRLAPQLKPAALIDVGDSLDGASISRHPMTGNDDLPSVQDELYAVLEQRGELMEACEGARLFWVPGNHCLRFDRYLAQNAPRMVGIKGMTLVDNLPGWKVAHGLEINWHTDPLLVLHNWKGGMHASHGNAVASGVHFVSGHDHKLGCSRYTNERDTLYGINPGVFVDPGGPQFRYTQGRPKDWRSGFSVLTFVAGKILPPEHAEVVGKKVYFRGQEL